MMENLRIFNAKKNIEFKDLFPDIDCPTVGNPEFTAAVQFVLDEQGYVAMSDQVNEFCFNSLPVG